MEKEVMGKDEEEEEEEEEGAGRLVCRCLCRLATMGSNSLMSTDLYSPEPEQA